MRTDEQLLAAAARGDDRAFAAFRIVLRRRARASTAGGASVRAASPGPSATARADVLIGRYEFRVL